MIPKFRIFDKKKKRFLGDFTMEIDKFGIHVLDEFNYVVDEDDRVLMQATGLTDKNGKEIFEGDVLHVWIEDEYIPNRDSGGGIIDYDCESGFSQIGKVEFEGSSFDYSTVKTLSGKHEEIYLPIGWLSNYEIIGNIHERPGLLEENDE